MGLFSKENTQTITQEPLLTDEQKNAMALLNQLGTTGSIPGLDLGAGYTGSLGNFNLTGSETLGLNRIFNTLQGLGSGAEARNIVSGVANTSFNPNSEEYQAFKRMAMRENSAANDALNRESAITGSRFGTDIIRQKQELGAKTSDILTSKLADLANLAQNRQLQASQALAQIDQQNLQNAFTYGALPRELENQEANAQYKEFQRQRSEKLGQVDALSTVLNKNVPYGVKSQTYTTSSPTLLGSLLQTGLTAAGSYFGGPVGASIGSSVGGMINGTSGQGAFAQLGGNLGQLFSSFGNQSTPSVTSQQVSAFGGGISPYRASIPSGGYKITV